MDDREATWVEQIRSRREQLAEWDERLLRQSAHEFHAKSPAERWSDFFELCAFSRSLSAAAPLTQDHRRIEEGIEEEGNRRLREWIRPYIQTAD